MAVTKKVPFKLEALQSETHFMEVPQHCFIVMKGKPAAKKLYDALVSDEEDKWGIKLEKKFGLSVGERNLIKDMAAARNEAVLSFYKLIDKLKTEIDKPVQEIQEMLNDPFKHIEIFGLKNMGEIVKTLAQLGNTDMNVATVTTMVQQRLLSNWTGEDTQDLHESLFHKILEYCTNEQIGWIEETDKQKGLGGVEEGELLLKPSSEESKS